MSARTTSTARGTRRVGRAGLALALAVSAGCSVLGGRPEIEHEEVPPYLAAARTDLAAGRPGPAIERLIAVREVGSLTPEELNETERLLEEATGAAIAASAGNSDELEALFKQDLPARLKALAGVKAAEALLAEGRRVRSFKMIRKVEEKVPAHYERALASEVLASAGLSLAADPERYGLFNLLRYSTRGLEALEFLVLSYPSSPRCPEAYLVLGELYEQRRNWDSAIERYEDLLAYHVASPEAAHAEARLPFLRLQRASHRDFDRGQLLRAEGELERWLARHPGHELAPWVQEVLVEARRRVAESDLALARYYERIESDFGTRVHAERSLVEAQEAGSEELVRASQEVLAGVAAPAASAAAPAEAPAQTGSGDER